MGDIPQTRSAAIEWPYVYLAVTVINIGMLIGIWYDLPESMEISELVTAGLIVSLYTTISMLYYFHTIQNERTERVTVVKK
jgi:uncharacterized membrane protein AbrB (regulator of aidB expression)